MLEKILAALRWRYAVKIFDSGKKVSAPEMRALLEAAHLSPSSLGLQPYKILVVENKAARRLIFERACDQRKVIEASHLLVICTYRKFTRDFADRFVDLFARERKLSAEKVAGLRKARRAFVAETSAEDLDAWAGEQAFIALGTMATAAALARIDACPMGGFKPEILDEVLNLKKMNLRSRVLFTVGYRSKEDGEAEQKKVRRPLPEFVVRLK